MPDRYTKFVLTVIALALVWLCVRDLIVPVEARGANAAQAAQSVMILASDRDPVPVKIVAIERTQWSEKKGAFETLTRSNPWDPVYVSSR